MATLYITEFRDLQVTLGDKTQVASVPPIAEQTVAIGAETDSTAFNAQTNIVRLCADAVCSVKFGTGNQTATTSSMRLAANVPEYFRVQSGDQVSVISNT